LAIKISKFDGNDGSVPPKSIPLKSILIKDSGNGGNGATISVSAMEKTAKFDGNGGIVPVKSFSSKFSSINDSPNFGTIPPILFFANCNIVKFKDNNSVGIVPPMPPR